MKRRHLLGVTLPIISGGIAVNFLSLLSGESQTEIAAHVLDGATDELSAARRALQIAYDVAQYPMPGSERQRRVRLVIEDFARRYPKASRV